MDVFLFFTGGLVFAIALFKRELLIDENSFKVILGISSVLFLAGLILHFTKSGRNLAHGALLVPLISLGYYRLCHEIFTRRFKREPRDTAFDWSKGMAADRVFNLVYFIVAFWLWLLVTIGMAELVKRGW